MQEKPLPDSTEWVEVDLPELLLATTSFHLPALFKEIIAQTAHHLQINESTIIRASLMLLFHNLLIKTDPIRVYAPPFMAELFKHGANPATSQPFNTYDLVTALFPDNKENTSVSE